MRRVSNKEWIYSRRVGHQDWWWWTEETRLCQWGRRLAWGSFWWGFFLRCRCQSSIPFFKKTKLLMINKLVSQVGKPRTCVAYKR